VTVVKSRKSWLISLAVLWCAPSAAAPAVKPVPLSQIRQNLFSTCFVGNDEGWVVGELGRVFRTTDGGHTFERSDTHTRIALLAVACLPDGTVVIVGQDGTEMRSRDSGNTWETISTGTQRNLLSVSFATQEVGVAVGDYGTILRTEDGGTTWTKISLPRDIPLPEDIAEIIEPGDVLLYDVQFATPERGWIVGEFGVILTTSDGGRTWTAQTSPVDTTLFGVNFKDVDNGWAVGIEQVLLHTTDGGATWKKIDLPARQGFVLALYDLAVKGSYGWAIGDSGLVLRSTDGGETWSKVDLPIQLAANWFRGIGLTPASRGLIVGSEGILLALDGEGLRELKRPS
jgi:photosystem II stability/assembly factor-like uncharacterized protein